jgi:hypothetical protein
MKDNLYLIVLLGAIIVAVLLLFGCSGKCVASDNCGAYDQTNIDYTLNGVAGWDYDTRKEICKAYQSWASNTACTITWKDGFFK